MEIVFDPAVVGYRELLGVFWRNIDPTSRNRQFCDFGSQYRSAIFYLSEPQREAAEQSRRELEESGRFERPVVTEIAPAGEFYPAEEYHRQYYKKEPLNYKIYHDNCGRTGRLKELWNG